MHHITDWLPGRVSIVPLVLSDVVTVFNSDDVEIYAIPLAPVAGAWLFCEYVNVWEWFLVAPM